MAHADGDVALHASVNAEHATMTVGNAFEYFLDGDGAPAPAHAKYLETVTLSDWLAEANECAPESPAILSSRGAVTYGELYRDAWKLAAGLRALGLRKGDVIGIQLPNVPEFIVSYCAISMLGCVLTPLHMPYRGRELVPLLNHARVRAVICQGVDGKYDAPTTMKDLRQHVPSLEFVIVAAENVPSACLSLQDVSNSGKNLSVEDRPQPNDPILLAFTSGTSAAPKCVARSYRTLLGNQTIIAKIYDMSSTDRILSAPPFTHVFGICCLNLAFRMRAAIVLMPMFSPEAFLSSLRLANVVFAGPAHIAACLKAGIFKDEIFPHVRLVGIAGSACPPEVALAAERIMPNAVVGQLWGMTETIMALVTPQRGPRQVRHLTVGRATPGIEVRACDEEGNELPTGHEGELQIRGYSVFRGYVGNPEANASAFAQDGWFKTGDLVTIDHDGNIAMTGRVKDIINRGGIKFNPADLETAVLSHSAVLQAAIVGIPDTVMGEKACLFVTLRPGQSLTFEDMLAYLKSKRIAKVHWPEQFQIVAEMPMTPTGKIIKSRLAQIFERSL